MRTLLMKIVLLYERNGGVEMVEVRMADHMIQQSHQ